MVARAMVSNSLRGLLLCMAAFFCLATSAPIGVYKLVSVSPRPDARGVAPTVQPEVVLQPVEKEGHYQAWISDFSLVEATTSAQVNGEVTLRRGKDGRLIFRFVPSQPLPAGTYELRQKYSDKIKILRDGKPPVLATRDPMQPFDLAHRFTVGP